MEKRADLRKLAAARSVIKPNGSIWVVYPKGVHEITQHEVMDAGKGVPETERERVFTPFYRLAGDTEGAGLGLALVQQIARLHGGDATVAPRPAHPSCFQVSLPAVG